MSNIEFAWNKAKATANLKKHGVSFEEAQTVFFDEHARQLPDHPGVEERFVMLGLSARLRILVVCHCYREDNQVIRILSARKATKREKKAYEEAL
ncbi:MAG: BrnT family toxin [Bdellovibrionales bacterium]|nr:BrnT family toxin [Bdellovibrionales bacterium]